MKILDIYNFVNRARARKRRMQTPPAVLNVCDKFFLAASGMRADDFKAIATREIGTVNTAELMYQGDQTVFSFRFAGDGFSERYSLDFNSRVVGVESLENNRRDRTTGRRMIGVAVIPAVCFDMERVEVSAGRTMGGFTWAKAGVYANDDSRISLPYKMRRRLLSLKGRLSEDDYNAAWALTALTHDTDLQKIAQLPQVLDDAGPLWDAVCAREYNEGVDHSYYVEEGYFPGGRMTLGQYLLCGQNYNAHIDVKNTQQLREIERYTGVNIRAKAKEWRVSPPQI
jgi:hypothetical protein